MHLPFATSTTADVPQGSSAELGFSSTQMNVLIGIGIFILILGVVTIAMSYRTNQILENVEFKMVCP